jgi:hypothetical protein
MFLCRNYLPLEITDANGYDRLLTVYLHFLPSDLSWANSLDRNIFLEEVAGTLLYNWDEIVQHGALNHSRDATVQTSFARMLSLPTPSAIHFVASYTAHLPVLRKSSLKLRENSLSQVNPMRFYPFEVSLWICPKAPDNLNNRGLQTPLDCLEHSDVF